jgi:CBS domain-containing protein
VTVGDAESVTVEQIMTVGLVWVDGDATLAELAATLADAHVGAVAVRIAADDVGIASERDVVRAVADGADLTTTTAADVASMPLVTAAVDDHAIDVAHRMLGSDVRHIVVTDRDALVGMVSIRDLLQLIVA